MINKDTLLFGSFAKQAGNKGCKIFNTAFQYHNINAIYKSFSVDSIENAISAAKTLNMQGFAVTMPYKKQVLEYVNEVDESAAIGASNTIINQNGKLKAYNTDYLAALKYLNYYNSNNLNFKNHKNWEQLYILGEGGYATAVKAAAIKLDLNPLTITRTNWGDISLINNSLVFNCTPVKNLHLSKSNIFIDCLVDTKTGHTLSMIQASYQYKLYTDLKFPIHYDTHYNKS